VPKEKLIPRHKAFAVAYAACLNGKQAAIMAGFAPARARTTASELLSKPEIRREVDRLIEKQSRMTAGEIIARLERLATGSIAMFLKPGTLEIDPELVHEYGDLIQSIWYTAEGPRLRLHDASKALELLGKARALFIERQILEQMGGMDIIESSNGDGEEITYSHSLTPRASG
jgi:phage terminase small subunit